MSTPQELVACVEKLASLPAIYHRIRDIIDDPDSSVQQLAETLSSDAAVTARVLRIVNSALYGFPGKVETVVRAANLMGMQQIHDLILSTSVISALSSIQPPQMPLMRFWKGCVFRGLAARSAARQLGVGDPERLFIEGLLADIGHLVMYQAVPDLCRAAQEKAQHSALPLHEVEQAIIGCNHAEVGAALASTWNLPSSFATVIGAQLMPALGGAHAMEAALLHVANHILATENLEHADEAALALLDPVAVARLDMGVQQLADIRIQARTESPAVIALFFPTQC